MSSKLLKQFTSGLTNPKGNLGDFAHASRMFVDADLRLAPKMKFLFHVTFYINTVALLDSGYKDKHQNEIGMLVKSTDLPKFSIQSETLNQYNRKKVVQNKVDYQPINMVFHDDNLGVSRRLWEMYFKYYYADPTVAANDLSAYARSAMKPASLSTERNPYGFDNNSTIPFFNKIEIYQMGKRSWNSYRLINPIITAWQHDTVSYAENAPVENRMTIAYESVAYDSGSVEAGSPPGFAVEHYDKTPSPLTLGGGGTSTMFGGGGVLAGVGSVFDDLGNIAAGNPVTLGSLIKTGINAANTIKNMQNLTKGGIVTELTNIATRTLTGIEAGRIGTPGIAGPVISGLKDTVFPIVAAAGAVTSATNALRGLATNTVNTIGTAVNTQLQRIANEPIRFRDGTSVQSPTQE
jgi:hypothetical protein